MNTLTSTRTCPRCMGPIYDLDGPVPDPEPVPPFCVLIDESHYECRLCDCSPTDRFSCFEFPRVIPESGATARQLADATLNCSERRRRTSESSMNARVNSPQQMNWLIDAARVATLVAEGNTDLAPLFWIRLYGILHDIYDKLAGHRNLAVLNGARPHPLIVAFLKATEDLSGLFSPDERLYIQYRRDVESHPIQTNYEFKVDERGRAVETFKHKMLAQRIPVSLEEFRAAVKRLLATVPDETVLARVLASRCSNALLGLREHGARIYT